MSEDLVNDIKDAVSVINDPHMGISIVDMGIVQNNLSEIFAFPAPVTVNINR